MTSLGGKANRRKDSCLLPPSELPWESVNLLAVQRHYQVFDGHTVSFETYHRDLDTAHLFRGLPGDSCQSPHWGLVQTGRVVFASAITTKPSPPARPTTPARVTRRSSTPGLN